MNDCDEPSCPCEGWPTLARLYTLRAVVGLAVQDGLWDVAKYDGLRLVVRAHEAAWQAAMVCYTVEPLPRHEAPTIEAPHEY